MAKNRLTAEELNDLLPPATEDVVGLPAPTPDFVKATTATVGPAMGDVLASAGVGSDVFVQDARVYEYVSTAPVEAAPIAYTDQKNQQMRGFAESQAALQCMGVQQFADPQYRENLKNIASKAATLPQPDVTAYVDNQRMILSSQVSSVPAAFDTPDKREASLETLELILGSHDAALEVCSCARSAGVCYVKLPLLWLSQMLAIESRKQELWENIDRSLPYLDGVDDKMEHELPATLTKLFSAETAKNIQVIARINRVAMLYVVRHLVDRICKARRAIVTPAEAGGSRFNDLAPRISGAA